MATETRAKPGRGSGDPSTSLTILVVTLIAIAAVLGPAAYFYVRGGL